MARSWDIVTPIPKRNSQGEPTGKVYWHKIGIAYQGRKEGSFHLTFNSLPLQPDVYLFEREEQAATNDRQRQRDHGSQPDLPAGFGPAGDPPPDDDIPF